MVDEHNSKHGTDSKSSKDDAKTIANLGISFLVLFTLASSINIAMNIRQLDLFDQHFIKAENGEKYALLKSRAALALLSLLAIGAVVVAPCVSGIIVLNSKKSEKEKEHRLQRWASIFFIGNALAALMFGAIALYQLTDPATLAAQRLAQKLFLVFASLTCFYGLALSALVTSAA